VAFSYLEELVGLKEVGSPEVLVGKLFGLDGTENIDSRVSASFESDTDFFVVIHDPSDEELYKLKVDLETGESKLWVLPNDGTIKIDGAIRPNVSEETLRTVPLDRQVPMPSQGFRMKIQPIIDASFRSLFDNNAAVVYARVESIFQHAKSFFKHASLTTKFELDVQALHNHPGSMKPTTSDLENLRNYVNNGNGLPLVNTYALLTKSHGQYAGWGFTGTVCSRERGLRTTVNGYYGTLMTAQILVHEIGHNLGMSDDYGTPRYSTTREPCTNIGSYMDAGGTNPNKWSPCSVEEMTAYYNSVGPDNYGSNCMTLLGTTSPATTKAPSTCTDANQYGYCSPDNTWACMDSRYPWFKEDCAKTCKTC